MKAITNLDVFIKVVEQGSFSAAARHFDITPSAISRQISQLEEDLGARLFHRTTRKQSLTEAGEIYRQYALRISDEIEAAQLAVSQLSNKPKGTLHIATEKDFATTFIHPLLPDFFNRYPEINLHLSLDANLVDLVAGGMDAAIRIGHLEDSSLIARKLVCASPNYFAKHSPPLTPLDLQAHNCLSFRTTSSHVLWRLSMDGELLEVPVSGNFRANSLAMLRDAALNDLGVIFIPQWFVQTELEQGLLQSIDFTSTDTPVYAVFANNRQLAPKVRAFVDFMVERLPARFDSLG